MGKRRTSSTRGTAPRTWRAWVGAPSMTIGGWWSRNRTTSASIHGHSPPRSASPRRRRVRVSRGRWTTLPIAIVKLLSIALIVTILVITIVALVLIILLVILLRWAAGVLALWWRARRRSALTWKASLVRHVRRSSKWCKVREGSLFFFVLYFLLRPLSKPSKRALGLAVGRVSSPDPRVQARKFQAGNY